MQLLWRSNFCCQCQVLLYSSKWISKLAKSDVLRCNHNFCLACFSMDKKIDVLTMLTSEECAQLWSKFSGNICHIMLLGSERWSTWPSSYVGQQLQDQFSCSYMSLVGWRLMPWPKMHQSCCRLFIRDYWVALCIRHLAIRDSVFWKLPLHGCGLCNLCLVRSKSC